MAIGSIKAVKKFWEENPLFLAESSLKPGSEGFFTEHTGIVLDDCLAGEIDKRIFPSQGEGSSYPVLEAGWGIGFWLEQLALRGFRDVTSLDISSCALVMAQRRMAMFGIECELVEGNLEEWPFLDESFAHCNCQGVVRHTPNPEVALAEIARVLRPGGTANISCYHEIFLLTHFDLMRPLIRMLARVGSGLKGRGRKSMFLAESSQELVRIYDGKDNPIGVSYPRRDFKGIFQNFFEVEKSYLHFFPRRAFRWIPRSWQRFCGKHFGLMIYASVVEKVQQESSEP